MLFLLQRVLVAALDQRWRDQVHTLDQLRRTVRLAAHGRRNPLVEYKVGALHLFEAMLKDLATAVTALAMRAGYVDEADLPRTAAVRDGCPGQDVAEKAEEVCI
jgi:preprotein translocase subunit SecA